MSDNSASDIHLDHPPQGDDEDEIDTETYTEIVNAKADEPVTQEVPPK